MIQDILFTRLESDFVLVTLGGWARQLVCGRRRYPRPRMQRPISTRAQHAPFSLPWAWAWVVTAAMGFAGDPARAEDFHVADGDVAGLIAAIHAANGNGEADTIHLAAGGTYSLMVSDNEMWPSNNGSGGNGLPLIVSDITIQGNGAVIERDAGVATVFRIVRVTPEGRLDLHSLTVRNGWEYPGGGVHNGGILEAYDTQFEENEGYEGSAIYNASGATLFLNRCTVSGNANPNADDTGSRGGGIANAGSATIIDSRITGNGDWSFTAGGGIWTDAGSELTLNRCTVEGNIARAGAGGGIYSHPLARTTISGSSILGNQAWSAGGGIYGAVSMVNSTVSGNSIRATSLWPWVGGGGLHLSGDSSLTHCAVVANAAAVGGGGIALASTGASVSMNNTLVAHNTGGDCLASGGFMDDGHNIVMDGSCISHATSLGGNPGITSLADHGGPTMTHALRCGSPALDGGDCAGGTVTEDQRGVARPQGVGCDIGPFESQACVPECDGDSFPIGDGQVDDLIAAIRCANQNPGPDTIRLSPNGSYVLTASVSRVNGATGLPSISSQITLDGQGATIERDPYLLDIGFRILHTAASGDLTLKNLTIRNGLTRDQGQGGGIYNAGKLSATNVRIEDCEAHLAGGAVYNAATGQVTLGLTTIIGNGSQGEGGGLYSEGSLVLRDCAVDANVSQGSGGGIRSSGLLEINRSAVIRNWSGGLAGGIDGDATLVNTTVAENTGAGLVGTVLVLSNCTVADNERGIRQLGTAGNLALSNTILSNRRRGDCVAAGAVMDHGYNIVRDGTCINHATSIAADPLLGPLADRGGTTPTHGLFAGSSALDAGDCGGGAIGDDQRGQPRPRGAGCDIGAFEACQIPQTIPDRDVPALIEALECANANPGRNVVQLATNGLYALDEIHNDTDGPNGLPSIQGEVVIDGREASIERYLYGPSMRILHVSAGGELELRNVSLRGGGYASGGGVMNRGVLHGVGVTLESNYGGQGGGISNESGATLILERCAIRDNDGSTGGGLHNQGEAMLDDCAVTDNGSQSYGRAAGIYNGPDASMMLTGVSVARNIAGDYDGGGIGNEGEMIIRRSTILGNHCRNGDGGGIANAGTLTIEDSIVADNLAGIPGSTSTFSLGGGIHNIGELEMHRCLVEGNTAALRSNGRSGGEGGGVSTDGPLTIVQSTIRANTANNGGGIYVNDDGDLLVTQSLITENVVGSRGGGINGRHGTVTLINSTVSGNNGSGVVGGFLTLRNCTVTGNVGTGVSQNFTQSGLLELSNTIIAYNGHECSFIDMATWIDGGFNLVEGGGECVSHPTSFAADPLLGPLADNGGPTLTHALLPGSPAIDAGDCTGGTMPSDQRGAARPFGSACDIGAFEAGPISVPEDLPAEPPLNALAR